RNRPPSFPPPRSRRPERLRRVITQFITHLNAYYLFLDFPPFCIAPPPQALQFSFISQLLEDPPYHIDANLGAIARQLRNAEFIILLRDRTRHQFALFTARNLYLSDTSFKLPIRGF